MDWHFVSANSFGLHREAWDSLNRQTSNSPLLEARFIEPFLKHLANGNEQLAIAGDISNPIAMSILTQRKFGVWSSFQPAQAPIGFWVSTPGTAIEELLASLAVALPGITLILGISQQDPLLLRRPADHGRLATMDYITTAHIEVDRSFENYWAARGKNLRHNLKRQRNRLEREGVVTRIEVLDRPEDMADAVRQYGEMESSGWKSSEGSAVHIDNVQGTFYADMLSSFAVTGHARVYSYYYGDKQVASDLCILGAGSLIILKTTYDESIEGSSPTMLMRQQMFQMIFAEQSIRRIEFYGKVMDWHTKWSDAYRVMYHVNYYPWQWVKTVKTLLSRNNAAKVPGRSETSLRPDSQQSLDQLD
ncbi:MAG: GNAT family N-acetyltransferase [Candidatus Methylumidiphilus sp.]